MKARTSSDLARRVSHRRARCASRRSDASAELMIVEVGVANARRFSSKVSAADHLANGCGVHKNTHARAPVVSEMHMVPTRLGNLHSGKFKALETVLSTATR